MLTGEVNEVLETQVKTILDQMFKHLSLVAGDHLLYKSVIISHTELYEKCHQKSHVAISNLMKIQQFVSVPP